MPAIPRPGESVQSAVKRQNEEGKKREVRATTARRNRGKKAPVPPKPKARGPLLSQGTLPVIKTGNKQLDRNSERRAGRKDAQYRRNLAVSDYTSRTKSEREKFVADAEKRVGTKAEQPNDQYVLDAHYRRTREQNPKVGREKVAKANARHDREVVAQRSRLAALAETQDKKGRGILGVLEDAVDSLPGGRVAREALSHTDDVGKGIQSLAGKLIEQRADQPGTGVIVPGSKGKDASLTGDPGRLIGGLGNITGNLVQAVGEDPKVIPKTGKGLVDMAFDIPAGVAEAVTNPKGILPGMAQDYSSRYGWAFDTDKQKREKGAGTQRERYKTEGAAPELVDVTGFATPFSAGLTKTVGKVASIRTPGGKVDRFLNAERPDLQVAPGVKRPQKKSAGIARLTAQRTVDSRRAKRVVRELDEAGQKKAGVRAGDPSFGRGVRADVPDEGAVAPLTDWGRGRQARKQTGRNASVAQRRNQRLMNRLSRPGGRQFRALKLPEQRAATLALEGMVNLDDAGATLRHVRQRVDSLETWRRENPDSVLSVGAEDELLVLRELERDLDQKPDKVLTPALRAFVAGEQARRPAVEQVALDSVSPDEMLARRFAPAGEHLGTRREYETDRAAVERLEAHIDAPDPVAAAQAAIMPEIEAARAAGSAVDVAALQAESQAVRSVFDRHATAGPAGNSKLDPTFARVRVAEEFADRTRQKAVESGLGRLDPVYVLHRPGQGSTSGAFGMGGAEHGAAAPSRRTELKLFKSGYRDVSASAYELGIQSAIKRSVQWRLVNEMIQDFVPEWSKNGGQGFTWKEFQTVIGEMQKKGVLLDPQDWTVWRPKREQVGTRHRGSLDEGLDNEDLGRLGETEDLPNGKSWQQMAAGPAPEWATVGNFYLVPKHVLGEMKRGGPMSITKAQRAGQTFTMGQTSMILASMPAYGVRQLIQTTPLVLLSTGGVAIRATIGLAKAAGGSSGGWFDPVFYRNLRAYVRTKKLDPDAYEDLLDTLGVRSKSMDAVMRQKAGSTAHDVARFESSLKHSWGGLFGALMKDYFLAERRSFGKKGRASQVGRSAGKIGLSPFRAIRDFNVMVDQTQDRWARLVALAAVDAKMSRKDAKAFGDKLSQEMATNAKRMGPIAAALEMPVGARAELVRSPKYRRLVEEAADGIAEFLGNYADYTQLEQQVGRSFVPFYGFQRHSLRLLAYTLPMDHPFMFAMFLQQSSIAADERERLVEEKLGKKPTKPEILRGYKLIANGDKMEMTDLRWMNPVSGIALELADAILNGSNPAEGVTGAMTPLAKAAFEAMGGHNLFGGQPLETGKGRLEPGDTLGTTDAGRLALNRLMGSLYPFRVINELANGEKGKLADTSLFFNPQPIVRKKGGAADKRNRKKTKQRIERGDGKTILDMTVPLRAKPADSLLSAAMYEKPKPKGKKKSSAGGFGGSGGSGSGW